KSNRKLLALTNKSSPTQKARREKESNNDECACRGRSGLRGRGGHRFAGEDPASRPRFRWAALRGVLSEGGGFCVWRCARRRATRASFEMGRRGRVARGVGGRPGVRAAS